MFRPRCIQHRASRYFGNSGLRSTNRLDFSPTNSDRFLTKHGQLSGAVFDGGYVYLLAEAVDDLLTLIAQIVGILAGQLGLRDFIVEIGDLLARLLIVVID